MGAIGAGLVLIALGAILKFAVTAHVSGIRLDVMGVVLILVGIASLVLGLVVYQNRRQARVVTRRIWEEHGEPEEEIIEERTTFDEPPA